MECSRINKGTLEITERDGQPPVLAGYAAVFFRDGEAGTEFSLAPKLKERILPGAFSRALSENQDVRALFNHDSAFILGRRSAGTLRLTVDHVGLRYEVDVPDTQIGRDLVTIVKRGDVAGSSFAFSSKKHSYIRGQEFDVRQIEDVDLFDVGPVTFPAYEATTAGVRSGIRDVLEEHHRWLMDQQARSRSAHLRTLRLDEVHQFGKLVD